MRQKVVAGNWKMNTTLKEGEALIKALVPVEAKGAEVIIAPPFTHLDRVASCIETVSYTHLTLPTTLHECRSRWSPYH